MFKGKQVNFIGRMASTFQVTYAKSSLKSTAGRDFKQLYLTGFRFGKRRKHFYEFIFVNISPHIMKVFSLIHVGYIFFNL